MTMAQGKKKPKKSTRRAKPARHNVTVSDDDIVYRRRIELNRLLFEGYRPVDAVVELLKLHTNGDTPYFTFNGEDGKPLTNWRTMPMEQLQKRAHDVVRKDMAARAEFLKADDAANLQESDKRVLIGGLRYDMQRANEVYKGTRSAQHKIAALKTIADLRLQIATLQGVEVKKPQGFGVRERVVAWIDKTGVGRRTTLPDDDKSAASHARRIYDEQGLSDVLQFKKKKGA